MYVAITNYFESCITRSQRLKRGCWKLLKKKFLKRQVLLIEAACPFTISNQKEEKVKFFFHQSLKFFAELFNKDLLQAPPVHTFLLPKPPHPAIMDDPEAFENFTKLKETEQACAENKEPCKAQTTSNKRIILSVLVTLCKNVSLWHCYEKIKAAMYRYEQSLETRKFLFYNIFETKP